MSDNVLRVLVVDDSAFMRRSISQMLSSDQAIEVVGTARDGKDALAKVAQWRPHVVTLDIEMPEMNGLEALRQIRALPLSPAPAVLMCSSLTHAGSHETLKALRLGAADFIAKDASNYSSKMDAMRDELVAKVKAIGRRVQRLGVCTPTTPAAARCAPTTRSAANASSPATPASEGHGLPTVAPTLEPDRFELIVIGSSTGGPPALETVLGAAGNGARAPIVVAQHMPALFTKSMAQRLDDQCEVRVVHGEDGMPLFPGTAVIIPGGRHGRVKTQRGGKLVLEVGEEPSTALYKPSVNELFGAASAACGARTLGVMLTGMGDDGRLGAAAIKAAGGVIVAQDEATSVVWGMPGAVTQDRTAAAVLPITRIATMLGALTAGSGARSSGAAAA